MQSERIDSSLARAYLVWQPMPGKTEAGAAGKAFPGDHAPQHDRAVISTEARRLSMAGPQQGESDTEAETLSEEEKQEVRELKQRDQQVRAHEQAHLAAAGGLARGGAHFEYETGPDGKRYAVGGEVSIDASPVEGDPEATLRKAARVRQAALAPADPSPQDRRVAAEAAAMAVKAQQELSQSEQRTTDDSPSQIVNRLA